MMYTPTAERCLLPVNGGSMDRARKRGGGSVLFRTMYYLKILDVKCGWSSALDLRQAVLAQVLRADLGKKWSHFTITSQ
jgi:hypothetical protein